MEHCKFNHHLQYMLTVDTNLSIMLSLEFLNYSVNKTYAAVALREKNVLFYILFSMLLLLLHSSVLWLEFTMISHDKWVLHECEEGEMAGLHIDVWSSWWQCLHKITHTCFSSTTCLLIHSPVILCHIFPSLCDLHISYLTNTQIQELKLLKNK